MQLKFIAVEKLVSIVFRHVMFCVTQAVTSLNLDKIFNLIWHLIENGKHFIGPCPPPCPTKIF